MAENILTERTERTWELVARLRVMVERLRRVVTEWDAQAAQGAAEELPGAVEQTVQGLKEGIAELLERIDGEMASMGDEVSALRTEVDTLKADVERLERGRVAAVYFVRPNAVARGADGQVMYGRVTFDADGHVQAVGIDPAAVTELGGVTLSGHTARLDLSALPALESLDLTLNGTGLNGTMITPAENLRKLKIVADGVTMTDLYKLLPTDNKVEEVDITASRSHLAGAFQGWKNLRTLRLDIPVAGPYSGDLATIVAGAQDIECIEITGPADMEYWLGHLIWWDRSDDVYAYPPEPFSNLRRFAINNNEGVVKLKDSDHDVFSGCTELEDLPVFDFSKATGLRRFYQQTKIRRIGVVTIGACGNISCMFDGCPELEEVEEVDCSAYNDSQNESFMYRNCPKLRRVGAHRLPCGANVSWLGGSGLAEGSPLLTDITIYGIGGGTYETLDLSSLTAWGDGSEQAARSLTDSLLRHSISRVGGVTLQLKLSAEVKGRLTEEQTEQLAALNFQIS